MTQKYQTSFIAWRYHLILLVVFLAAIGLLCRIFDLSIREQHFLRQQGDERVLRLMSTPAIRGMIVDRNHFPLAVSTTVYSAWMNPQEFSADKKELSILSKTLGIKQKEITTLLKNKKHREFTYLKRALSPEVAQQIKALHINGVHLQQEYRRFYPEGEVTSHIVGLTNIDDQGQEGLELAYNDWLAGEAGKKWVIKDRLGRIISDVQKVQDQKAGRDVTLSIDRRIQYLAYRELVAGVLQNHALSGSVVVLDVKTGEVLAMVNYPSFNPNNRSHRQSDTIRNRAVTDIFEPGSTMKAFSISSALQSGQVQPATLVDTHPGWVRVGHNLVRDHENNGVLTVTQILQKSSNVGTAKIILNTSPNQLWQLLHNVGFGEITGVGFPGEQNGVLVKHNPWGAFTFATLAFGYGMSATTLQLARAYAVLANEGVKVPITLLKISESPQGERVMNTKIAKEMLLMLESVVAKGGTAEGARVPGYRVAGKSGTAKKVGAMGYEQHRYTSSFVGIAPLSHPRLVVAVVLHDPQGKQYYGGLVSGPIFEKIMEGTLRILDIPPDDTQSLAQSA